MPRNAPHTRGRPMVAALRCVRLVITCLLIVQLAGCAGLRQWVRNGYKVGPSYSRPAAAFEADWVGDDTERIDSSPAQTKRWWTIFGDPVLDDLIEKAHRQNLDLRTTGARIIEARAQRSIAVGGLFPQSQGLTGAYAYGQIDNCRFLPLLPHDLSAWATGLQASWEPDFWGRYRRTIESYDANLTAAVEGYRDALVLLLADVAANYITLRTYEQRIAWASRNVNIQQGSLQLAEIRFAKGAATAIDSHQARANLAQTQAMLAPLEIGRRQTCHQLCILLGIPPSDLAARLGKGTIPRPPLSVAVGVPSDLLCRRPDVRQAEREAAAQCARIGVAKADYYPRVALTGFTGFVGYAPNDLQSLVDSSSLVALALPNFQWNLLNYGRIASNVQVQDARFQQSSLQYRQTVLTAAREVEDGLVAYVQSQHQARYLQEGVAATEQAVKLVIVQFKGGATDFNRVYTTQGALVTQQDQLAVAHGNIAINLVQIFRALGGGWDSFSPPADQSQAGPIPDAIAAETAAAETITADDLGLPVDVTPTGGPRPAEAESIPPPQDLPAVESAPPLTVSALEEPDGPIALP